MRRSTGLTIGLVILMMTVMTFTVSAATVIEDFPDVDQDTDHVEEINALYQQDIIKGTPGGTFNPNNPIYRGHAALMIFRALDISEGNPETSSFEDYRNDEEENAAIAALQAQNIVDGTSETTFGLRDYITRGQVAKIIVDAYDIPKDVPDQGFTDVGDTWYDEHINALAEAGVVQGVGNNQFGVDRDVKRDDFSKMLKGAMDYNHEDDGSGGSDDGSGGNDDEEVSSLKIISIE